MRQFFLALVPRPTYANLAQFAGPLERRSDGCWLIPHFSNSTRHFFRLHFANGKTLWRQAIQLKHVGGVGECEKMAQLGDSFLKTCVMEILNHRNRSASSDWLHKQCQRYITNQALAQLSSWTHLGQFLWSELQRLGAEMPPKLPQGSKSNADGGKQHEPSYYTLQLSIWQQATVYEALLWATVQLHGKEVAREVVQRIMHWIDGDAPSSTQHMCGSPVFQNGGVIGMLSCVMPGGITVFPPNFEQELERAGGPANAKGSSKQF
jgi:hypothetical protein